MSRSGGRGDHRGNRSSESPSYYSAQPTPTPHGDTGHGSNANSAASGGGYHSGSGTTSIDENEALIWYRRTPAPLDSNHPYQDPSPLITFTKGGVSLLAQAPGSGNYLDMTGYTPDVIGRILRDPEHVMTPLAQYPFPEDPRLRMLSLLSPENSSESRPNALRRPFRFRFKGRGRRAGELTWENTVTMTYLRGDIVPTADSSCCTIM
ncbi:hypothetical protein C8Q78DRAFT_64176 [Trametes maxima]|nr:hypothetical protein C8Q78DRAFT_64176 [Trametes maxima]